MPNPALQRKRRMRRVAKPATGDSVGAVDRGLPGASPRLAAIGTEGGDLCNWLLAGQALQRVLLSTGNIGRSASYLNQPIQVVFLRLEMQNAMGVGFPRILLHLGSP